MRKQNGLLSRPLYDYSSSPPYHQRILNIEEEEGAVQHFRLLGGSINN